VICSEPASRLRDAHTDYESEENTSATFNKNSDAEYHTEIGETGWGGGLQAGHSPELHVEKSSVLYLHDHCRVAATSPNWFIFWIRRYSCFELTLFTRRAGLVL